jgi:hypothetical protein
VKKLRFLESEAKPLWDEKIINSIQELMAKKYLPFLERERFMIEAGQDSEQVQLRVTLICTDGSIAYPVECVYPFSEGDRPDASEIGFLMLDYIDVYWNEYLTGGRETFVPIDWSKHSCEGEAFFIRGFVRNLGLEEEAETLFEKEGHGDHEIRPISSEE